MAAFPFLLKGILIYKGVQWTYKTIDALIGRHYSPKVGSIVYCNLGLACEHTGIYVGNNQIVHLNGNGMVELVSPKEFCNRLQGLNPVFTIFCMIDDCGSVPDDVDCAKRAMTMVGKKKQYSLVSNNCHNFTAYCMTGKDCFCNSFSELYLLLKKKYGRIHWRPSDLLDAK
jgi:hypothetical protein